MATTFDFKTATPSTSIASSAYLFGADSQSATNPSIYALTGLTTLYGTIPFTGGTITANSPAGLTQTWNNAGVTFTGYQLNITDTASNAASLLMDLQVASTSKFNVTKGGRANARTVSNVAYALLDAASPANSGMGWDGTNRGIYVLVAGGGGAGISSGGFSVPAANTIGWSTNTDALGSVDLTLTRDAANTLAQRNGSNAQVFRVYNTYTDASNYERGTFQWAANTLIIGTENAGTGSARNVTFNVGGGVRLTINTFGPVLPSAGFFSWLSRSGLESPADGNVKLRNAADSGFSLLQFGGTTSSFPSLKKDGVGISARLADDSAGTWFKVLNTTVSGLPSASTSGAGAIASVSDALGPVLGSTVAGSGAITCLVVSDGTNWKVA